MWYVYTNLFSAGWVRQHGVYKEILEAEAEACAGVDSLAERNPCTLSKDSLQDEATKRAWFAVIKQRARTHLGLPEDWAP